MDDKAIDWWSLKVFMLYVLSTIGAYYIGGCIDDGRYGLAAFIFTSILVYWLTRINFAFKYKKEN